MPGFILGLQPSKLRSSPNWLGIFILCGFIGVAAGYLITLLYRPSMLPPILRVGSANHPTTVLVLGTDVVYLRDGRGSTKVDRQSFRGLSDTIMVARFDPYRDAFSILSVPRDTTVFIPGRGYQKINAANALGGPQLARETVARLLGIPIDHYVVINVHGLVELVDELGGIEVDIPKRMKYRDRAAGLNIDLHPGTHKLDGYQAMGFVRFRHDEKGDIGRVQRQEIFLHAILRKALDPDAWSKVPRLIEIAQKHVHTDLSASKLAQLVAFARSVPKENQQMVMLPGRFSGTGNWEADEEQMRAVVVRMLGRPQTASKRADVRMVVENASSNPATARKLQRLLSDLGYNVVACRSKTDVHGSPLANTRIIAQRANPQDALMVKKDLNNCGDIINASVGDIESTVTVIAGDDLLPLLAQGTEPSPGPKRSRRAGR